MKRRRIPKNGMISSSFQSILINLDGELLAKFNDGDTFEIGNTKVKSLIQPDGSLKLSKEYETNTRDETYRRIRDNMKCEFRERQHDLSNLNKEIALLIKHAERKKKGMEDNKKEISKMLLLKEEHQRKIYDLKNKTRVSVTYQKNINSCSVILNQGIFARLSWSQIPVMWVMVTKERIEKKEETVTEKMDMKCLEENTITTGKLYVMGGNSKHKNDILALCETYDPEEDEWTSIERMSVGRCGLGVTVVEDQIYAIGGIVSGVNYVSLCERYDPARDEWKQIEPMVEKRAYFGVATLNGQIYAAGGHDGYEELRSAEQYDPKKNKWTAIAKMNRKRFGTCLSALDGHLYSIGGRDSNSPTSSVERYDPKQNRWTASSSMSCVREDMDSAVLGGQLYVLGGYNGSVRLSSVERYDPITNIWTLIASMNSKRRGLCATAVGNYIYAVGGVKKCNFQRRVLSSAERYDPITNEWTKIANMSAIRCFHGLAAMGEVAGALENDVLKKCVLENDVKMEIPEERMITK